MVVCAGERGEGKEVDGLRCRVQLKQTGPAKEIHTHGFKNSEREASGEA